MVTSTSIQVFNSTAQSPFKENDVVIATNQRMHMANGTFNAPTLTYGSNYVAIGVQGCNINLVNGDVYSSNIFGKFAGVNRLDLQKPINIMYMYNSTGIAVPGYTISNDAILLNANSIQNKTQNIQIGSNQAALTSAIGIAFQSSSNQLALLQVDNLNTTTASNAIFTYNAPSHDNIVALFDAYSVNSVLMASASSTVFRLSKESGKLLFTSSSNTIPDAVIASLSNAIAVNSNGFIGIQNAAPTSSMHVSGNVSTNKIISPSFKITQLATNNTIFTINPSLLSNKVYTSPNFTSSGGALLFDTDITFYAQQAPATPWVKFNLVNLASTATYSWSNSVPISLVNNHRLYSFSRVATSVAADTYTLSITLDGVNKLLNIDTSDYLNITVTEFPL